MHIRNPVTFVFLVYFRAIQTRFRGNGPPATRGVCESSVNTPLVFMVLKKRTSLVVYTGDGRHFVIVRIKRTYSFESLRNVRLRAVQKKKN